MGAGNVLPYMFPPKLSSMFGVPFITTVTVKLVSSLSVAFTVTFTESPPFNSEGMIFIEFTLIILIVLTLGTLKRKNWAWLSGILFFILLILSIIITSLNNSYADMLNVLSFPVREMNAFQNVPLQGYHFIIFFGIPVVLTVLLIYKSKKYFSSP